MPRKMKDSGIEWIGEIPEGWEVKKLKYIGSVRNGLTYEPGDVSDEGLLVLRSSNIQNNKLAFNDNVYVDIDIRDEIIVRENDLLICSRNGSRDLIGKCALIDKETSGNTFGAFMCIFRSPNNKYIYYTLLSPIFSYYLSTFLTSTINQLTSNNLYNIKIPIPIDFSEQQEITGYLDKKCSAIDKLIELQKSSIEKLQEYKKVIITEAVTKGLNPNVPMKDSGIEWIGEIPEHWEAARLKNLFILQRGYDLAKDEFVDAGIPVYGSNGIIGYHNIAISKAPNVTIGRSGSIGEVNYIQDDFWPHNTTIFIKNINQNNVKYIYYILCSIDIKNLGSGSAVPTLDRKNIQNFFYPYTTGVAEQQAIAAYLDQKCSTIDKTIAERQDLIEKLTEYKKSLIYEAVTGKVEVLGEKYVYKN
ncbi:type I restriction enzyme specificity protein [Spirochaetia bacterium]|nr:type I restriction enzyme specificity protein [Spirochaetia bacterium]